MKVVLAPDKFQGTLSALEAVQAMSEGVKRAQADAEIAGCAMSDGGEGTVACLLNAIGGKRQESKVSGPTGDVVRADWALLSDGTAALEMASASGIRHITPSPAVGLRATSRGTGELVAAALASQPRSLVIGIGGSASTDGGTGAAAALGWRFLDRESAPLEDGGRSLVQLTHIEPPPARLEIPVVAACDVMTPLLGPHGSARLFAPQKGAGPNEVDALESGLENLARVVASQLGVDVADTPGAGAGGGTGAGLLAFLDAAIEPGAPLVAKAIGLDGRLVGADLVITGEGRLDEQSLFGKVVAEVARAAGGRGVPCGAVVGTFEHDAASRLGLSPVLSMVDECGEEARRDAYSALAHTTERLVRSV